jgi:hypothetical protein
MQAMLRDLTSGLLPALWPQPTPTVTSQVLSPKRYADVLSPVPQNDLICAVVRYS